MASGERKPRIEVKAAKKLDVNGNKVYYYRFIARDGSDLTDYFVFLGTRSTSNHIRVIRTRTSPADMERMFKTSMEIRWYNIPELVSAQKAIDKCNSYCGCHSCCSRSTISECYKIKQHEKYSSVQLNVCDIMERGVMVEVD